MEHNTSSVNPFILLQVEWRGILRTNAELTPRFILYSPHQSKPEIRIELDQRLEQGHWKQDPKVEEQIQDPSQGVQSMRSWKFDEPLSVKPPRNFAGNAVFSIRFEAIFDEMREGQLVKFRYKTSIDLVIPEENSSQKQREIVIESSGQNIINTEGLDWAEFDKVIIRGDNQAIINMVEGISSPKSKNEKKPENKENQKDLFQCFLSPIDFKLNPDSGSVHKLILEITDGTKTFYRYLYANSMITVGRNVPESRNDLNYGFMKQDSDKDSPEFFLSKLVSRKHCSLLCEQEGFSIFDHDSSMGTDVFTENKWNSLKPKEWFRLQWENLKALNPQSILKIALGKTGVLKIQALQEREYFSEISDLLGKNGHDLTGSRNALWRLGNSRKLDGLKITREKEH
ncbi:MAG: FHA domain-containing protein [Planctomycetia bacterium]|nr:FHA domain-containing protein [Planctomycetia bacterium]